MGAWSQPVSKLLSAGPSSDTSSGTSLAPLQSGAGGAVPSSLLTSKGYYQPPDQNFANQLFGRNTGQGQQLYLGDILAQLGIGNGAAGAQTMQQPLNYYSGILSGDRQQMLQTVAPETNTILSQYDSAKRNVAENAPRGGGANTTLANAPYSLSGQITNLLNTVRPQAAAATTDIGKFLDTLGTTQTSQASNLINQNAWTQLAKANQQAGQAGALGSAIGSILAGAGVPGLLGNLFNQNPAPNTAQNPIIPQTPALPTIPTSAPALPGEGSGAVPNPSWNLYPGAVAPPAAAGLGTSGLLSSQAPVNAAATSSILGFEDPLSGAFIGSGTGAGGAGATAGGLAPETGLLGTDIPSGSMFAPGGAYSSFAGVGPDVSGGATAGGGAGGSSGSSLLGGALGTAGSIALGAGLPLGVLSLLGIGPSQIFGGVPTKGTQQSVNANQQQVAQSNINALRGQSASALTNGISDAVLHGVPLDQAAAQARTAAMSQLDNQFRQYVTGLQNWAKSNGWDASQTNQTIQQLTAAYQTQKQKIQAFTPNPQAANYGWQG